MILLLSGVTILLLLGIVQGATEFLPVSSHGHLVLLEHWLGVSRDGALGREIALHLGTLLAVVIFCRRDLLALLRERPGGAFRVVLASALVTAAIGLGARDLIENALASPAWIGAGLAFNGLLMGVLAPRGDERLVRRVESGTWRDGLVLGLLQSLALVPSVSRSAATIVAALWLGYARREAVRVAFLISVPVVAGAELLTLLDAEGRAALSEPGMLPAMLLALVTGLGALRFLTVHVDARSLRGFAAYCLALAAVVILVG